MRKKLLPHLHLIEIILIFFVSLILLVTFGTYMYFANTLGSKTKIMNNNDTGVVLLDRTGTPFFTFYEGKNRAFVPLSKISPYVPNAVIAVEDKEFFQHNGVSLRGIGRSLIKDISEKRLAFGGSTITQQLVKNVLLTSKKSFLRKYQEIVLAREIERRFSKKEILEMYLNSVYFGEGAFGIQEAAKRYFGTDAANLTLAQASFLAGILPAPSLYSPYNGGLPAAETRQRLVLSDMKTLGFIKQSEYDKARNEQLAFKHSDTDINALAPHFALMIKDFLIHEYGEEKITRGGLRVYTTLDIPTQRYAEQIVRQDVDKLAGNKVTNAAAVVMDTNSRNVLALVGSADWFNSSFGRINMATSPRQPGSSFKPIVYATAFEEGKITTATQLHDTPTSFRQIGSSEPVYKPKDYDGKYRGIVLPRRALANSLNIPAVEVMSKLSVEEVLERTKSLGVTTLQDPSHYGLSLVLGTAEIPLLQMTNAYATLADRGVGKNITTITQIKDKNGDIIFQNKQEEHRVFTEEAAYLVTNILSDNRARREMFGSALTVSIPAAVKTGTTENYRDAWTIGYTPTTVVGVWVGNSDGSLMDNIAGSLGAAPIWKDLITYAAKGKPIANFTRPSGVIAKNICVTFGSKTETASSSAFTEYFIAETAPTRECSVAASSSAVLVPTISVSPPTEVTITPTGQPTEEKPLVTEIKIKKRDKR